MHIYSKISVQILNKLKNTISLMDRALIPGQPESRWRTQWFAYIELVVY